MAAVKQEAEHPELGEQFRSAATKMGLSSREVAERAGLTHSSVRNAFMGRNITVATLRSLAAVLGLARLDLGGVTVEAHNPELLRQAAERARAAAELLDQLQAGAEKRAEAAELAKAIGGRARARQQAGHTTTAADGKTQRKR